MTPEFTDLVYPIFRQVLAFLDEVEGGAHPSLDDGMARARTWVESADRRATAGGRELAADFALARYGLVSWIDEILTASAWGQSVGWGLQNHVLEYVLYEAPRDRFRHFYKEAAAAELALEQKRATADPLETYYLCVAMGFVGVGAKDPAFFDSWLESVANKLELYSPGPERPFPQKNLPSPGLTPRRGAEVLLTVSLLVALTAAVTVVAYTLSVNLWYNHTVAVG